MATARQKLGKFGEERVVKDCTRPSFKRARTLARLPTNFKCADVICDFCGNLAQVKGIHQDKRHRYSLACGLHRFAAFATGPGRKPHDQLLSFGIRISRPRLSESPMLEVRGT